MIPEKSIPIHQLKYSYDERHGFIFKAASQYSPESIQRVADNLIASKITDVLPEFVTRLDGAIIFVYPEGISFQSGEFFQKVNNMAFRGLWEVDTLSAFLKEK